MHRRLGFSQIIVEQNVQHALDEMLVNYVSHSHHFGVSNLIILKYFGSVFKVWGRQLTSRQLMEKKEKRRQRFTYEVDFDDFKMPFNKNVEKKALELSQIIKQN